MVRFFAILMFLVHADVDLCIGICRSDVGDGAIAAPGDRREPDTGDGGGLRGGGGDVEP